MINCPRCNKTYGNDDSTGTVTCVSCMRETADGARAELPVQPQTCQVPTVKATVTPVPQSKRPTLWIVVQRDGEGWTCDMYETLKGAMRYIADPLPSYPPVALVEIPGEE
jgi:hypothetical protein